MRTTSLFSAAATDSPGILATMDSLPGEAEAAARLTQTSLRNFGVMPERENDDDHWGLPSYRFSVYDAPVPSLYKYALSLIGCPTHGPGEKVLWWVEFTYRGEWCELALQKFGLRIYLRTDRPEEEARATQAQIAKQLRSSMRTVENVVKAAAPDLLKRGQATVKNQHTSLLRAYQYFRERAENPEHIEDEQTELDPVPGTPHMGGWSFKSGKIQMDLNSFHDMIAAINAYISLLEHDLVLALAFCEFDPDVDNLTEFIGSRWGEKWDRILGKDGDAEQHWHRLFDVAERWRNPYSHGGFEKGHSATIWIHTPGVNAALPVGLTRVTESPVFSFSPGSESTIAQIFAVFDEIDRWMAKRLPEASGWTASDLDVRYDEDFRSLLAQARAEGDFEGFLSYSEYAHDQFVNMDF